MIQLQALNNILDKNNLETYLLEGITKDYFYHYKEEFNFIYNHYRQYNKVPDLATFINKFRDFEVIEVLEPVKMIIYYLKEEYLFAKGKEVLQDGARILENNAFDGIDVITKKLNQLIEQQDINYGVNTQDMKDILIKDIKTKREMNNEGIIGIKSGFDELDEITHGWLKGDELVTIVGRVNQGKSWLLQKFLVEANKQGKRVLHYSGEMGVKEVMYRKATLKYGISNTDLMTGNMTDSELNNFENLLEQDTTLYQVITPNDLGGTQLTVSKLRSLIKKYKPDIIGIDQISLMDDERRVKGDTTRIQYNHISQDLFKLSSEFEIPILLAAQANRNKGGDDKLENPELIDVGESDGVAQNSSRVISLVTKNDTMKLKLIKNRYGKVGWNDRFSLNLDRGEFNEGCNFSFRNKKNNNGTDVF